MSSEVGQVDQKKFHFHFHTDQQQPKTTIEKVQNLVRNQEAQKLAKNHELIIQNISWEVAGPDKNWGPCTSDITLEVGDEWDPYQMPIIRRSNYTDKTSSIPIDSISVLVGNEKGEKVLTRLQLKEYLNGFSKYASNGSVKGSLLAERDTHVIHSVQTCLLPCEEGKEVDFNVALFNSESTQGNPAILAILVSSHGTSAQVVDNGSSRKGEQLMFNINGKGHAFSAGRLKDVREQQGDVVKGSLSDQELANRKLLIIQIPLKVKPRPDIRIYKYSNNPQANMDQAQIKEGHEQGGVPGLKGIDIERDSNYPIRVTTQLYKITNDGTLNEQQMQDIALEIQKEESSGKDAGRLVAEVTPRPTEWVNKEDGIFWA